MVSPPTVRFRPVIALVVALLSAFLAIWIVIPAPNRLLLPLAVGAPEISAWLLVAAGVAIFLALPGLRQQRTSQVAAALALVTVALAASPFVRFARVANAADHALREALGADYVERLPAEQRAHFLTGPLSVARLFRGLGTSHDKLIVTRGVGVMRREGIELRMDVYRPSGEGEHPLLVQVYGGAWQRGEPADFAEFATYIAAQGYVVVAIDYRHAPTYVFPAQLEDVKDALTVISEHAREWHADISRMVLIGRSAGAHLALLAAYAPDAPPIRGVIDYYGPVDLVEGYRHPPVPDPLKVRSVEEALLGGPPDAMPDRYRAASPLTLVNRRLPPTLLIYGGRDHIVEPRFGVMLAEQLRRVGSTVVHVELPWAEHAFDAVPNGVSGQLSRYVTERFLASVMERER